MEHSLNCNNQESLSSKKNTIFKYTSITISGIIHIKRFNKTKLFKFFTFQVFKSLTLTTD